MFTPEEQQINICAAKKNLEQVENELVERRRSLPELKAEYNRQVKATSEVNRAVHYWNSDYTKLKEIDVQLTAKRAQLNQRCNELTKHLDSAQAFRDELTKSLEHEETEIEKLTRNYLTSLKEKEEQFRITRVYYDREEMEKQQVKINTINMELEQEIKNQQDIVNELILEGTKIRTEVPENLLDICGKQMLDEKIKALSQKFEALTLKIEDTLRDKNTTT